MYIRDTKVLPLLTIFVACCNRSTNDKISHFVALLLWSQVVNRWRILTSLSSGRWASILTVSRVIPRNENDVVGPSTFSIASGTPSWDRLSVWCLNFADRCLKMEAHFEKIIKIMEYIAQILPAAVKSMPVDQP